MNNPNNKDSAIKKERSELYAVKPIATNAVVRTPAILMEIKNQRVNLFDNRTDLILPGKVQVF